MRDLKRDQRVATAGHTAITGRRLHLAGYPAAALAVTVQPDYSIPVLVALGAVVLALTWRRA